MTERAAAIQAMILKFVGTKIPVPLRDILAHVQSGYAMDRRTLQRTLSAMVKLSFLSCNNEGPAQDWGYTRRVNEDGRVVVKTIDDMTHRQLQATYDDLKYVSAKNDRTLAQAEVTIANLKAELARADALAVSLGGAVARLNIEGRKRPDGDRPGVTGKFAIVPQLEGEDPIKVYLTMNWYPDGSPCEVFFKVDKQGSTVSGLLDQIAIDISVGLQHGAPIETFLAKMIGTSFKPCGYVTGAPRGYSTCRSLLDLAGRWMKAKWEEQQEILAGIPKTEPLPFPLAGTPAPTVAS